MKSVKLFFALINFMAVGVNAFAQCTVTIPTWANVINTTTTIGAVADTFWVCSGDTLNGSGFDNVYYVESGGALDMSGVHKTVYLKTGASIICSGIDDTIYYEAGAIISCSGNHFDSLCTQLVFDYLNAPANGCVLTGLSPNPSPKERGTLQCFPNPVKDELTISGYLLSNGEVEIKIFDVMGKETFSINTKTSNLKLQTSNFPKGIYFLKAGISVKMFTKE